MYQIIGVLPRGFTFDGRTKFWTLMDVSAEASSRWRVEVIGRLRSGVTAASAQAELRLIDSRSGVSGSDREQASVESLKASWIDEKEVAKDRFTLLAIASAVLLIANLNVAGLSFARSAGRHTEYAVFLALGVPRASVVRQSIIETCAVTVAGGSVGLIVAALASQRVTDHFFLNALGTQASLGLSVVAGVLVFMIGLGTVIGIAAPGRPRDGGIATALRRVHASGGARLANTLRQVFVGCEATLALVILAGAGLVTTEYAHIVRTEVGFDPRNLWTVVVQRPQRSSDADPSSVRALAESAADRFARIPGVAEVTMRAGDWLPPSRTQANGKAVGNDEPLVIQDVAPNFFRAMGIPVLQGQAFSGRESATTQDVAIINRRAADRIWPGRDPVGEVLRIGQPGDEQLARIVGVVADYETDGYLPPQRIMFFYRPISQGEPAGVTALLRLRAADSATLAAIHRATIELRKGPVGTYEINSVEGIVEAGLAAPRFNAASLATLAAFGMLLVAVGIYGIVASTIVRRTKEIGIRAALGATPRQLLWHVSGKVVAMILIATVVGLCAAMAATRLLKSQLYVTNPTDPRILGGAAFLLILVGLASAVFPARRILKLETMAALRSE